MDESLKGDDTLQSRGKKTPPSCRNVLVNVQKVKITLIILFFLG